MTYPIPSAALDDRLAIVGTSGSGKTYAACTAVERLLRDAKKVVVIDPLGVWWGLRSTADGKGEGFPIVIFGGEHGDVPISESAGRLIGEAIAGMAESCIVDLSTLGSKAAERRFMLALLEALYEKAKRDLFHLIFDEADLWAPQRPTEPQLLNRMENIVRRGRVKGFIPWLITQRPAVISKDVLSQVDGLVALKLTAPADLNALGAWIEGQADKAEEKAFRAKLPKMKRGEGVLWIPGREILAGVQFPTKTTFDSSSTPKRGETRRTAALQPIDLGKLKGAIAAIEASQAEHAASKRQPKTAVAQPQTGNMQPAPTFMQPDPQALRAAEDRGRAAGIEDGRRIGRVEGYKEAQREALAALTSLKPNEPTLAALPARAPAVAIVKAPAAQRATAAVSSATMSKAERAILTALAQYPAGRTKSQVAILTGYSSTGGGFGNALSSLRVKGWLAGDNSGTLQITSEGAAALGPYEPLPSGEALLEHWNRQLSKAERACLAALVEVWPSTMTKDEVAARAGYEATGGGFGNALSRLRTLELISGTSTMKASDDLFWEAA